MKNKLFRKIPEGFITIFSLAALAAINYTLTNSELVFIFILVLLIHEFGHYFAAKKNKAFARLPIFIPLPFLAIGITKVKNLTLKGKKDVAFMGPLAGALASFLLIILNSIFKFTSSIPLIMLFFGEIIFNYFGADGKQYRRVNRSIKQCIF